MCGSASRSRSLSSSVQETFAQKRSTSKVCIKRARLHFDKHAARFIAIGLPSEALPFLADVSCDGALAGNSSCRGMTWESIEHASSSCLRVTSSRFWEAVQSQTSARETNVLCLGSSLSQAAATHTHTHTHTHLKSNLYRDFT